MDEKTVISRRLGIQAREAEICLTLGNTFSCSPILSSTFPLRKSPHNATRSQILNYMEHCIVGSGGGLYNRFIKPRLSLAKELCKNGHASERSGTRFSRQSPGRK